LEKAYIKKLNTDKKNSKCDILKKYRAHFNMGSPVRAWTFLFFVFSRLFYFPAQIYHIFGDLYANFCLGLQQICFVFSSLNYMYIKTTLTLTQINI